MAVQGSSSRSRAATIGSYGIDFGLALGLLIVSELVFGTMIPRAQFFDPENPSLMYPYHPKELVPNTTCAFLAAIVPMGVIGLFSLGSLSQIWNRRLWDFTAGTLGLLVALSINSFITNVLKAIVGKPRPDILSRCVLNSEKNPIEIISGRLISIEACTQKDISLLLEGFRSFPSGHSSTAFAGLGYLSLFLAGRLQVFDNRGIAWKAMLCASPLVLAMFIAASRISDSWHHPFDVLFGSFLGILIAIGSYRQYFPSPTQVQFGGRAFSPRKLRTSDEICSLTPFRITGPGLRSTLGSITTNTKSADIESQISQSSKNPYIAKEDLWQIGDERLEC